MLHFRSVGQGRPLVIVHGLFGSGDNWQTLAGKFPGWKTYLPDLRNHGQSPWFDTFTHGDLAADLASWAETLGLGACPWVGHSLGGKAVMELALTKPQLVCGVAALDMSPLVNPARYSGFISSLKTLDLKSISGRSDAQTRLEAAIPDRATLQFLLKSLVADETEPGTWRWRLNLDSLERNYNEIWKGLRPGRIYSGPALFLRGGLSDFVSQEDTVRTKEWFPAAQWETIPGAGHWLHAEKPAEVLQTLNHWLDSLGRAALPT